MFLDGAHIRFQFRLARRAIRRASFRAPMRQVMQQGIDTRGAHIRVAFQVAAAVKFWAGAAPFQTAIEQVMPRKVYSLRNNIRIILRVPEGVKVAGIPQKPQVGFQNSWEDASRNTSRFLPQRLKRCHELPSKLKCVS